MAENETHKTNLEFDVKDKASSGLEKIGEKVEHLSHRFDGLLSRVTEMGTSLAGLGGAFGFEQMIEGGKESLEQLKRISELTDMTTQNVAGWRDVFEQSDVSVETFSRAMTSLSRKTLSLEEGSKQLSDQARRWGVDLTHGPERALLSMSKAVKSHRIDLPQVATLMRVSGEEAGAMMGLLRKGDTNIKSMVEHAKQLNMHLAGHEAMERFEKFHVASVKIHQAWRQLSERVVVQLAPVMTRMASYLTAHMDHIVSAVMKFTGVLEKAFAFAVAHAKQIAVLLGSNIALEKFTGKGLFAHLAGRAMGKKAAEGEGGLSSSVSTMHVGVMHVGAQAGGGKLKAGFGMGIQEVGLEAEQAVKKSVGPLAKLGESAGRFGAMAGGLLAVAGKAFVFLQIGQAVFKIVEHSKALQALVGKIGEAIGWLGGKVDEMADHIGKAIDEIVDKPSKIWESTDYFGKLQELGQKRQLEAQKRAADELEAVEKKSAAQSAYMTKKVGQDIVSFSKLTMALGLVKRPLDDIHTPLFGLFQELTSLANVGRAIMGAGKAAVGALKAPEQGAINYDFRGSRFDIEQKFAEGFDPDRIAVAFANDLATLGERKMTSTLGPQFIR